MARPRIFISSTFYDLKHIRSSLEGFISDLGFEAILSEKGSIAYDPAMPLDQSCYREAETSDIFVLIIGGRYGSEISDSRSGHARGFFERYESITKAEFSSAYEKNVPTYILIERSVYSEYETYLNNKGSEGVNYAHVDSINVFRFIDEILNRPRNNPVFQFDKYAEIQSWLREQWAGYFKELLARSRQSKEIASLSAQVTNLSEINKTLRSYMEQLISKLAPDESSEIISREADRLDKVRKISIVEENEFSQYLTQAYKVSYEEILNQLESANSLEEFFPDLMYKESDMRMLDREGILNKEEEMSLAAEEINLMRRELGLSALRAK